MIKNARDLFCLWGLFCIWLTCLSAQADSPRVFPVGELPDDSRLGTLRHLRSDYFPFQKVESADAWTKRASELRRQVRVATGLWPLPSRTPLNAKVHSPVDREEYTVWRVSFESMPGHYVTGSLFRPKNKTGKLPAVLSPHGHYPKGRFHAFDDRELHRQISVGGERFEVGGRHPVQARCVQLARMGCVVFQYDMDGYADSVQRGSHTHGVRENMNSADGWGLNTARADLSMQNLMGLQTWNSVRALDFLSGLEDVDPSKIIVTGSSGGGTQTFMLMAVDDRPIGAVPCVMVSTAMQGGCQCENAPYLRIEAGNVDIAALAAPRPLALTAADDWTRELKTKGYPDLLNLYTMLGHKDRFSAVFHTHFKHNYNGVNRSFMYGFVNDMFGLGFEKPILERDYVPLTREEQTVWTKNNPKPSGDKAGEAEEQATLRWWKEDAEKQLAALHADKEAYAKTIGGAWDVMIGRRLSDIGSLQQDLVRELDLDDYRGALVLLGYEGVEQIIPTVALGPSDDYKYNQQAVLWLTDTGKAGLLDAEGEPIEEVAKLLDAGFVVIGIDMLYQGEFLESGEKLAHARLNHLAEAKEGEELKPWDFYHGYNRPLIADRVHDVLATVRAIQTGPLNPQSIHLVGVGAEAGVITLAARVQAGEAIDKTAVATQGFSFSSITRRDDPMFLPGVVRYEGVDGLKRLIGDSPLKISEQASGQVDKLVEWVME